MREIGVGAFERGQVLGQLSTIDKKTQGLGSQEERLLHAFQESAITIEQLKEQNQKILQKRDQLQTLRSELTLNQEPEGLARKLFQHNKEHFSDLISEGLEGYSFEDRKSLISLVADRVTIDEDGNVELYCGLPLFDEQEIRNLEKQSYSPPNGFFLRRLRLNRSLDDMAAELG
ncbi:MAG: hypothetical protein OSB73_24055 [Candidatus Latescibacteria bacterium]|nr:hypothetical protein [Candidatus Latescibacterota bacterium]